MTEPRELAVGATLGRYELILRIASGGMGEVWAARLRGTRGFQKVVAVKTLLPELSRDPGLVQMFLDEASIAARLKHPNIVEVIDLGEEDGVLYQAMEWVDGGSLWTVMRAAAKRRATAIPVDVAASVVAQICSGLQYAHDLDDLDGRRLGLVHRDVSPQNVLITAQGHAKIADFGIAMLATSKPASAAPSDAASEAELHDEERQNQELEPRGKVPYMSPEQARGEKLDARSDVFTLGVLFYQLVAGSHPFRGAHEAVTLKRISSATPATPLADLSPTISPELSDAVGRAMSKDLDARLPNAAAFRQLLEKLVPASVGEAGSERVREYCGEVCGDRFTARTMELRAVLRSYDDPGAPRPGREAIGSAPRLTPVPTLTPPALSSNLGPGGRAERGSAAVPLDEDADAYVPPKPRLGLGGMAAVAAAVATFVVVAVVAATRSGASAAAGASLSASASAPSVAASLAPSVAASLAPSVAASLAPSVVAPPLVATTASAAAPPASASATPVKLGKGKLKKTGEFTPSGL
jgi:serine/threonine-protein kinase